MKILLKNYDIEIDINSDSPVSVNLESPSMYRSVMSDLWNQNNGSVGNSILSDAGKELIISKKAELIFNPFDINLNEKRLLNALYLELMKISTEELFELSSEVNSRMVELLDNIESRLHYSIEYETDFDISAIAKAYKVRFEEEDSDFISKLVSYSKLVRRVLGKELFIFSNLKQLMTPEELHLFYRDLKYEDIIALDIEGAYMYKLPEETCIIIDKDECRIDLG